VLDIRRDPAAMAGLQALGLKHVPVLARGSDYVFGQQIPDVARFVGVEFTAAKPLEPAVLIERWTAILASAQRLSLQLPVAALGQPPTEGRPGTLAELAWHVFSIGDAFIDCVEGGNPDWVVMSMRPPQGAVDGPAIAAHGAQVVQRLAQWWAAADAARRDGTLPVRTFQGEVTLHAFLERQTWHSAQHTRQLADVIERHGGTAHWPERDAQLAGLPLPDRIWV
jgi:hypothetical protein